MNRSLKVSLPTKWLQLLSAQCIGVLFPLTFFPMGVWGAHTFDFYLLCAVVQSAVLYCGTDLFDQSRSPYLWSVITYFVTALGVGVVGQNFSSDIWLHDGSCVPFGAPTIVSFVLAWEFLPLALIFTPAWMAIRWIETSVQPTCVRRKHLKVSKNLVGHRSSKDNKVRTRENGM